MDNNKLIRTCQVVRPNAIPVDALYAHTLAPSRFRLGAEALTGQFDANLILLDLALHDLDGFSRSHELPRASELLALICSSRGDQGSAVDDPTLDTDDHQVRPIRQCELLPYLELANRHAIADPQTPTWVVRVSDLMISFDARTVQVGIHPVRLTNIEFDILAVLARNAGTAIRRGQIMKEVWGSKNKRLSRTLDVHLSALRAKLNRPGLLHTIRGFGYRLG